MQRAETSEDTHQDPWISSISLVAHPYHLFSSARISDNYIADKSGRDRVRNSKINVTRGASSSVYCLHKHNCLKKCRIFHRTVFGQNIDTNKRGLHERAATCTLRLVLCSSSNHCQGELIIPSIRIQYEGR